MSGPSFSTSRPVLAELPARPVNQRPKLNATKTSPADVPKFSTIHPLTPPSTPPSTPPKLGRVRSSAGTEGIENELSAAVIQEQAQSQALDPIASPEENKPVEGYEAELKLYDKKYQMHEELGHGVWSKVYRASEVLQPTISDHSPLSPPTSPTNGPMPSNSKALAVKKPLRRDANKVLEREARILSSLHFDDKASFYLVPFHGFDVANQSIVLDAILLSLETHVKSARDRSFSTKIMFDPIIGAEQWANLAENLISGLVFLHSQGCVHGDIKPANILLQPDEYDRLTPMYCDFSSARIIKNIPPEEIEEVSAVTAEYTSPELLESLRPSNNNRAVVNFASDIFALAVTLLFAATGESPYACVRLDIQKLGMAKEGTPLEYARRGVQASRIMKGRAVEKALKESVAKVPEKRLNAEAWKAAVQVILKSWKDGGWARGG